MKNKVVISIAKATVLLTLLTILSKFIGLVREMIYARNFGLTSQFDLFLVSAVIPIVINTSVIYLGQHYFIPAYNRVKSTSDDEAIKFFSTTFWSFILGGVLLAFILFIFSGTIINIFLSSQSLEYREIGTEIFLLFLLTIPINAGMFIIIAYQQANFHFIYPAVTQIIMNLVLIVIIIAFTNVFQIFVLPLAFLISYVSAFVIMFFPVRKFIKLNFNSIFKFRKNESNLSTVGALIIIEGLSLSYILVDRYFFGEIPSGSIAALNYAIIIFTLPVSIFSISLITTFFSKFSKFSVNNRPQLILDFKKAVKVNIYIMLPVSIVLIFGGDFFIEIFYKRGKFTAANTILTHSVLQYYVISLVFYSSYLVIVKLLYSVNKYKHVLIISVLAFLLKVILNFSLVNTLQQEGLALSTSLVYVFLFLTGSFLVIKVLNMKNRYFHFIDILYFLVNAAVSYLVSYTFLNLYGGLGIITEITSIVLFLSIYIINSKLLNDEECGMIANSVDLLLRKVKRQA
ncbi:MAG: polysaccharide biosynthesis C-terminal domain-containing protein [Ignavibacterium sp.]|nr:MAG: polysaccharide biosynthesis C-terminal domain-containing protein [Ignavibacterium sp.]